MNVAMLTKSLKSFVKLFISSAMEKITFKDVRDRIAIMVCEVKCGAKILPPYSPLDIKVKQQP